MVEARPMGPVQRAAFAVAWLFSVAYVGLGLAAGLALLFAFRKSQRAREHAVWLAVLYLAYHSPLLLLGSSRYGAFAEPGDLPGWLPGGPEAWSALLLVAFSVWVVDAAVTSLANCALAASGRRPFRGIVLSAVLRLARGRRKPVEPDPDAGGRDPELGSSSSSR